MRRGMGSVCPVSTTATVKIDATPCGWCNKVIRREFLYSCLVTSARVGLDEFRGDGPRCSNFKLRGKTKAPAPVIESLFSLGDAA